MNPSRENAGMLLNKTACDGAAYFPLSAGFRGRESLIDTEEGFEMLMLNVCFVPSGEHDIRPGGE